MAIYKPLEVAGGGWRLALPQNGASYVILAALEPELDRGTLRATVVLLRDEAILAKDRLNLTRAQIRKAFVETVVTEHQVTVPEGALLALEEACRRTATVRHASASPGEAVRDANGDALSTVDPVATAPSGPLPPLAPLLDAIVAFLCSYLVFRGSTQAVAIALWIAHVYVLDVFDVTAYLHLRSPEKRSGKTRLLELIEVLVPRPWRVVGATAATIFRKIECGQPTVLLDEVDTIFKQKATEASEALRSVLNAGYRRGAVVPRCVGQQFERIKDFPVFGAKALAGLHALPDNIADRTIAIGLVRRKKSEHVKRFRFRLVHAEAAPLRAALVAWAAAAIVPLRAACPNVPEVLDDRTAEIWEPLLAIADLAGGTWPERARTAALALRAAAGDDGEGLGVVLLTSIRAIFTEHVGRPTNPDTMPPAARADDEQRGLFKPQKPADKTPQSPALLTTELLAALVAREGEPWGEWWGKDVEQAHEKGRSPQGPATRLARMLKPFDVQPRDIRTPQRTGKGYVEQDFAEAFERYLPSATVAGLSAEFSPSTRPETPKTSKLDPESAPDAALSPFLASAAATPRQPTSTKGLRAEDCRDTPAGVAAAHDAEILGAQGLSRRRGSEREKAAIDARTGRLEGPPGRSDQGVGNSHPLPETSSPDPTDKPDGAGGTLDDDIADDEWTR